MHEKSLKGWKRDIRKGLVAGKIITAPRSSHCPCEDCVSFERVCNFDVCYLLHAHFGATCRESNLKFIWKESYND